MSATRKGRNQWTSRRFQVEPEMSIVTSNREADEARCADVAFRRSTGNNLPPADGCAPMSLRRSLCAQVNGDEVQPPQALEELQGDQLQLRLIGS